MRIVTVDFETAAIVGNPLLYPPTCLHSEEWPSAGVAVWVPDQEPWFSLIDKEVTILLRHFWEDPDTELLFQNAPFDLSVARKWLGLEFPPWHRIHDTMYLIFHENPYADLGLKPSAERILGLPADEQLDLKNWILANVPGAKPTNWGAFISKAPFEIVSRYGIGDAIRTRMLYDELIERRLYE